jgi:membrane protease YdiL (CAAX protease family)
MKDRASDHRLGLLVIAGFVALFVSVWIVNAVFGVGVNWVMRWLQFTPNVRVFFGSTLSYGGRLAVIVLLSALAVRKLLRLSPRKVMFSSRSGWWKDLLVGFLLAAGVMLLVFAIEVKAGWLVVEGWNWQVLSPDAWLRNLWLAILVNATAAVGEEAVFRGYLLTGLARAWGQWIGLTIMAVVFAALHLLATGAEETYWLLFVGLLALPGLLLGWAYLKAGSLWLPIGMHAAWNLFQDDLLNLHGRGVPSLVGAVTRQQGPEWFVGTTYGIEVGLAGILAVVLVWVGVWLWTTRVPRGSSAQQLS